MNVKKAGYDFNAIEKKWQQFWEERKTFKAKDCDDSRTKYYVLDMFPYPSAAGLHVGHPEGYTASDIVARYKRMKGFNVLHPMGYDAFGLPAEQYAVKTGTDPKTTTQKNVDNIRKQIKSLGFSYDWDREVNTTDPNYYKWTQWIFLKLFNSYFDETEQKARPIEQLPIPDGLNAAEKQGYIDDHRLAYEAEVAVNWCPELGTVLANEEVIGGVSERGGHPVIRKPMRQWMLRITKYAERLLSDLNEVDWPYSIKKLQVDWIGKSDGADVDFKVDGFDETIRVFTTRPDTLFGATYMVLAPEHPLVDKITSKEREEAVNKYREVAARKSDLDRTDLAKEKTGEPLGAYAINPVNNEKIPIWISDYVLISYGTGAIMAVPGHDERDFEFAKEFNLPIRVVVMPDDEWLKEQFITMCESEFAKQLADPANLLFDPDISKAKKAKVFADESFKEKFRKSFAEAKNDFAERVKSLDQTALEMKYIREGYLSEPGEFLQAFIGEGDAVNSGQFNGLTTDEFKEQITNWLAEKGLGQGAVNYKLRDWLFSRQRYWGEPFPILHTGDGGIVGLSEEDLPLELPVVKNYKPAGTGESPLANIGDWINVELPDGSKAKRETNTMPQWAGSCWYYLRYLDPDNNSQCWDPEKEKYWMPVDLYIGGAEHAVLHLLYSRFWHKLLYDLGYVTTKEPFKKLINQGMILGEDGQKMSKSRGNVINPDKVITDYGADSMRLYEMFMGPLEAMKPWSMQGVEGVHRFLQKAWRMIVDEDTEQLSDTVKEAQADEATLRLLNQTIKKVGDDIESFGFNTAISQMMIFVNHLGKQGVRPKSVVEKFVLILAPLAPHIAEELWEKLGHAESLVYEAWPEYDKELIKEKEIELAVQVNGKIKDRIVVSAETDEEQIKQKALACEKVIAAMTGKSPKKIIVVKPRIVSIIT